MDSSISPLYCCKLSHIIMFFIELCANCLIFSCNCHIFCLFIGIKFNIDKVAPTRNNLKTPKIFRRFAPEMYTIWGKSHYQRISQNIHILEYLGVVKLKIKFSIKKKQQYFQSCFFPNNKSEFQALIHPTPTYFMDGPLNKNEKK